MRQGLVRFRSMVHMYVNRKQYVKVSERVVQYVLLPGGSGKSEERNVKRQKSPLICLQMKLEARRRAAEERRRREMVGAVLVVQTHSWFYSAFALRNTPDG